MQRATITPPWGPQGGNVPFPQAYPHHMDSSRGFTRPTQGIQRGLPHTSAPTREVRGPGVSFSLGPPPCSPPPPPAGRRVPGRLPTGPRAPSLAPATLQAAPAPFPPSRPLLHAEARQRGPPRGAQKPFRAPTPRVPEKHHKPHFGAEKSTGGARGPGTLAGGGGAGLGGAQAKPPPRPRPDPYPSPPGPCRPCPPPPRALPAPGPQGHAGGQGPIPARATLGARAGTGAGRRGAARAGGAGPAVSCFSHHLPLGRPCPARPPRPLLHAQPLPLASPPARLLLAAAGGQKGPKKSAKRRTRRRDRRAGGP
ncbi:basic proline-rich protein-like [Penaeus monodon]|uniref:basic proline-rich protein-like n=1 Tax=Penaeus monodon TaxID=6687 RepID=UPI0018A6E356|nr:basic proline-rich protein-like [Penaeus monodon]